MHPMTLAIPGHVQLVQFDIQTLLSTLAKRLTALEKWVELRASRHSHSSHEPCSVIRFMSVLGRVVFPVQWSLGCKDWFLLTCPKPMTELQLPAVKSGPCLRKDQALLSLGTQQPSYSALRTQDHLGQTDEAKVYFFLFWVQNGLY